LTYYSFFILFTTGSESFKGNGKPRSIQSFATATTNPKDSLDGLTSFPKQSGEKWFDIYSSYWNDVKYADTFTSNACNAAVGTDFETSPAITTVSQGQGCKKGAQYQVMPMWVIHEMEAAITKCKINLIKAHWDEAFAYYSGSLILDPLEIGVLQYGLAEKRGDDFNTRVSDTRGQANVNIKVTALFESGRDMAPKFQCSAMETTKEALVKQFTVALVQGVMKYLYLADTNGSEKEKVDIYKCIYTCKYMFSCICKHVYSYIYIRIYMYIYICI
jgi:hypothetical protein